MWETGWRAASGSEAGVSSHVVAWKGDRVRGGRRWVLGEPEGSRCKVVTADHRQLNVTGFLSSYDDCELRVRSGFLQNPEEVTRTGEKSLKQSKGKIIGTNYVSNRKLYYTGKTSINLSTF